MMLGDLAHMVERLLRMREALGSIPRISIFKFFCAIDKNNVHNLFKGIVLAIYKCQNVGDIYDIQVESIFHQLIWDHVIRQGTIPVECGSFQFHAKPG